MKPKGGHPVSKKVDTIFCDASRERAEETVLDSDKKLAERMRHAKSSCFIEVPLDDIENVSLFEKEF